MAEDRTMYIFRDGGSDEDPTPAETREYEVIADAETIGEIDFGAFYFTVWELGTTMEGGPGRERALCLRVRYASRSMAWDTAPTTAKGYYHGGGAADEIVILSSLFLRRRLSLGRTVRLNDTPRMFDMQRGMQPVNPELISETVNLESLTPWFDLLQDLEPAYHQHIILSAKFYQQALQQSQSDPTTAYLNLVSAIEVLAGKFDIGEVTIKDLDPTLASLVEGVRDEPLRQSLERALLKRERFIKRRFREFVLEYVDQSFFRDENEERFRTIKPGDLPGILNRVYDQRSTTLHAGEAFPPYIDRGPHRGEDLPLGLSYMSGNRSWDTTLKAIPLLHAFERLTRHVLLNFLRDKCGVPREQWKRSLEL